MKNQFMLIILLMAFTFIAFGCESSSDDDDDNDSTDDEDLPVVASVDMDDDDDNDTDSPQPYTPCCDVEMGEVAFDDPGLNPGEPGSYSFITLEREFFDSERERSIKAYLVLPSEDGQNIASGAFPIVTVAHGFSGLRTNVIMYAETLASWGYIAIVPQLPFTSLLTPFKINHVESAKDLLFLLNTACCEHENSSSVFYGRVDRGRLGMVGHSMGGKLSVLASLLDGGPMAVAGLDPVDGSDPTGMIPESPELPDLSPSRTPDLLIPTLYMGSEVGGTGAVPCAPTKQNYHEFWLHSPSPSVEVTFWGADHTDFIAQLPLDPCNIGTADHGRVKELAQKYVVAFLNDTLLGWSRFKEFYAGSAINADAALGDVSWQEK